MDREVPLDWPSELERASPELRGEGLSRLRALMIRTFTQRLPELFEQVDEQLFAISGHPDAQQHQFDYFHAMGLLRKAKRDVLSAIIDDFKATFDSFALPGAAAVSQPNELEVLDESVLEEMLALEGMVSRTVEQSQPALGFLMQRVAYLVGHSVPPAHNPFSPEEFCRGFLRQIGELSLGKKPREATLVLFTRWVSGIWPKLVTECNALLTGMDVLPNLEQQKKPAKKAAPKPPPPQPAQSSEPDNTERTPPPPYARVAEAAAADYATQAAAESDFGEILTDVARWLRTRQDNSSASGGESLSTSQILEAVQAWQADSREQRFERLASAGLEQALADMLDSRYHSSAMDSANRMVVRLLDQSFQRLRAQRLSPHELSDLLLHLEVPVACLAMRDPTFLERSTHPARRLLDELCKASSTFMDDERDDDPLRNKVGEVVEQLSRLELSIKELTGLLTDFIDFVERDKRQQAIREERVLEEARASARVSEAHSLVVRAMRERLGDSQWPEPVLAFCERAWCKVLFLALLRQGADSAQWDQGMQLLDRLLMMASARQVPAYNQWNQLHADCREQLDGIGYSPALADSQIESMRLALRQTVEDAQSVPHRDFAFASLDLPGEAVVDDNPLEEGDMLALAQVDALRRGTWLEFEEGEGDAAHTRRCKLAGLIKGTGKYIFTNRRGSKVAEFSRYQLAHRFRDSTVTVLDNAGLFEGVYEGIVRDIRSQLQGQAANSLH